MKPDLPVNEAERLDALRRFDILDTPDEEAFNDIVRLAAYICKTPIALITLLDTDRQWFKARIGMSERETSRDVSFCAHAILQPGTTVVPDATADERFKTNPFVVNEPHIRFYAGAPLTTDKGYKLGTLCVVDHAPKELSQGQIAALQALSNQAITLLEMRRKVSELENRIKEEKAKNLELESEIVRLKSGINHNTDF